MMVIDFKSEIFMPPIRTKVFAIVYHSPPSIQKTAFVHAVETQTDHVTKY